MTEHRTTWRFLILIVLIFLVVVVGNAMTKASPEASVIAPDTKQVLSLTNDLQKKVSALPLPSVDLPAKPTTKPLIYAKSYVVIDDDTKYPLAAKDADQPVPIASTTKIMTTLVALDTLKLDQVITISREAAAVEGSEIQLLTNEKMTTRNLLYAMLLSSANDGAMAIAQANGSTTDFVAKMNAKAKLLGLTHTEYHDPAGLDDTAHSSARDLAILMAYALKNPTFKTIISTPKYTIMSADGKYAHELTSSNRLIRSEEPLFLANALGGKTGFTYEAGHCLVAAAEYKGKQVIAVILNTTESTNDASAKEARKLLTWASSSL